MVPEYDDRERLSWSEIDKRKNRSSHRVEKRSKSADPLRDQRALSKYKAKLEDMFSPDKKGSAEELKILKKLRETTERPEFLSLASEYLESFGLPSGWEHLEIFLRHDDPQVLAETIRRMEILISEQNQTRKENFTKDLHMIEMTTRDKDLRKQVTQLLKK